MEIFKILYIDDQVEESSASEMLENSMKTSEHIFIFTTVPNIFIGLECTKHTSFSLIIVKRLVKNLEGLDMVRILRNIGMKIPIVCLTEKDDEVEARANPDFHLFSDIICKPYSLLELKEKVYRNLNILSFLPQLRPKYSQFNQGNISKKPLPSIVVPLTPPKALLATASLPCHPTTPPRLFSLRNVPVDKGVIESYPLFSPKANSDTDSLTNYETTESDCCSTIWDYPSEVDPQVDSTIPMWEELQCLFDDILFHDQGIPWGSDDLIVSTPKKATSSSQGHHLKNPKITRKEEKEAKKSAPKTKRSNTIKSLLVEERMPKKLKT